MAAGFYSQIDGDVTVTVNVSIIVNGREEKLPFDWPMHIRLYEGHASIRIERDGTTMPISEAFALKGVLTTRSRPKLRRALP